MLRVIVEDSRAMMKDLHHAAATVVTAATTVTRAI
jgi:hypothetical protein